MSLVAKPEMTERKLAAVRANGRLSQGPATPAGRERNRNAHVIHGYYARGEQETLSALGEDPQEFEALRQQLQETWRPGNRFEEELVGRLVRALWRMNRAHRVQEGLVAREHQKQVQARAAERNRDAEHLQTALARLEALALASQDPYFVTRPEHIDTLYLPRAAREVAKLDMKPMLLLYQLVRPGKEDRQEGDAPGLKDITPAQGPERQEKRQELHELAVTLAQRVAEAMNNLPEPTAEPPWEGAANLATSHPHAALMGRMEDASFRQVWRLTNLLIKIKKEARESRNRQAPKRARRNIDTTKKDGKMQEHPTMSMKIKDDETLQPPENATF